MTKEEALRMALEALEFDGFTPEDATHRIYHAKAITAIKKALEQEKALQALHDENERLGLYKDAYGQPEPEPVAWAKFSENGNIIDLLSEPDSEYVPLYTSPPKREWQGLTDEDVEEVEQWVEFKEEGSGRIPTEKLIRYIEAKLKEKNT